MGCQRGSDAQKHVAAVPRPAHGHLPAGTAPWHPVKKHGAPWDPLGTHRGFVFMEHLVVAAQRHAENDGRDILKAVDPLLAFRPLPSDIEEPAAQDRAISAGSLWAEGTFSSLGTFLPNCSWKAPNAEQEVDNLWLGLSAGCHHVHQYTELTVCDQLILEKRFGQYLSIYESWGQSPIVFPSKEVLVGLEEGSTSSSLKKSCLIYEQEL